MLVNAMAGNNSGFFLLQSTLKKQPISTTLREFKPRGTIFPNIPIHKLKYSKQSYVAPKPSPGHTLKSLIKRSSI